RFLSARYRVADAGSFTNEIHWYDFDAAGRVTIDHGELDAGGYLIAGRGGTRITYDDVGRRESAYSFSGSGSVFNEEINERWSFDQYIKEIYSYDDQD